MTLRIATYNIRKGGGPRHKLLAEVLAQLDADVVVLEEAVDVWVVAALAEAIRGEVSLAAPGRSVAVLSRIGVLEAAWGHGVGSPRYAEVRLPGQGVRILGLHLTAGLSGRGERRRLRELEHVLAAARGEDGGDVVIAGDMNSVAPGEVPGVQLLPRWIRLLLSIDGGISTRVMERVVAAGFVDAFRRLHPDQLGATLPAMAPVVRLDYFLLGPDAALRLRRCEVPSLDPILLAAASDHLPLVLELDRAAPPSAPGPRATDQQRVVAAEMTARNGDDGKIAP